MRRTFTLRCGWGVKSSCRSHKPTNAVRFGDPLPILALLAALLLVGCAADANTPYGSVRAAPTGIVNVKRTRATRHVEATPTAPASDECECKDGFCVLPPKDAPK